MSLAAPLARARDRRGGTILALVALILGLIAWWVLTTGPVLSVEVRDRMPAVARNLASGLFLTAGVLRMAGWRLTRDWAVACSALVLLAIGTALPATSLMRVLVQDGDVVDLEAPETRLLFAVPVVVLAIAGARHSRRELRRTLAVVIGVGTALPPAALTLVGPTPAGEHDAAIWLATEGVVVGTWLALALQAHGRHRLSAKSSEWVVVALTLMALADLLKTWSLADAAAPHLVSAGFQLAAAAIAVCTASRYLWTAVRAESADAGILTQALADTQQRLDRIEQLQRERLHDARSAVLGVVGASQLLARPAHAATQDVATLQALVAGELARLQGLLDIDGAEAPVEFDLTTALGGVVLARRLDGTVIDTDWADVRVFGHPRATATVLDNLLRNAHRHAPRARVRVAARTRGAHVEITVTDDGPGIPAAERQRVLLAGVRGSTARGNGSGLGLYSAARAMAAQDGSLEIAGAVGGGTSIRLRIPAAVGAVVRTQVLAS